MTSGEFTHLDHEGRARMVDVGDKPATARVAVASGRIRMDAGTLRAITSGEVSKGDVLAVARVAGIQAAKETGRTIPLCHPLGLDSVTVEFEPAGEELLVVTTEARVVGKTGVEMEALVAASTALLTVYDMCKARDRGMVIEQIQLEKKSGGRSGEWTRDSEGE